MALSAAAPRACGSRACNARRASSNAGHPPEAGPTTGRISRSPANAPAESRASEGPSTCSSKSRSRTWRRVARTWSPRASAPAPEVKEPNRRTKKRRPHRLADLVRASGQDDGAWFDLLRKSEDLSERTGEPSAPVPEPLCWSPGAWKAGPAASTDAGESPPGQKPGTWIGSRIYPGRWNQNGRTCLQEWSLKTALVAPRKARISDRAPPWKYSGGSQLIDQVSDTADRNSRPGADELVCIGGTRGGPQFRSRGH